MPTLVFTLAVFSVLWTLWSFLNWVFDLIERAWEERK